MQEWEEPGAYEVAPDVFRIPLPLPQDGLRAVNVYAIRDGDRLVLVDGGWAIPESRKQLATALAGIGADVRDITRVLVTHIHRDHYTQAVALRREFGAQVWLGRGEQPALRAIQDPDAVGGSAQFDLLVRHGAEPVLAGLQALGFGMPIDLDDWQDPDEWLPAPVDVPVTGRTLRAVPTPGHTSGHVVFADLDSGLLFAGDHVLPHITPSIGFEPDPAELPLQEYLDSLRVVRGLPDLTLLPAHGPTAPGTHRRIDELLAHHADRLATMHVAVGADLLTAYDVARRVPWTRRERRFADLDPFNQMLAVCETGAHLDLLAVQGRLVREDEGVQRRYRAADGSAPS